MRCGRCLSSAAASKQQQHRWACSSSLGMRRTAGPKEHGCSDAGCEREAARCTNVYKLVSKPTIAGGLGKTVCATQAWRRPQARPDSVWLLGQAPGKSMASPGSSRQFQGVRCLSRSGRGGRHTGDGVQLQAGGCGAGGGMGGGGGVVSYEGGVCGRACVCCSSRAGGRANGRAMACVRRAPAARA